MKRFNYILIIVLLAYINGFGQTKKSVFNQAESSFASKNYYDAFYKYSELLEFDPSNCEYLFKAASSARLFGAYKKAAELYEKVLQHSDNNQFPLTGFYLGQSKQLLGDYNGARLAYTTYKSERGGDDPYYTSIADKEIKACEWALETVKNPVKGTVVKRLSDNINSLYSDFNPVISGDDLLFSSLRFENKVDTRIPKRFIGNILKSKKGAQANPIQQDNINFAGKSIANLAYNKNRSKVYFSVCEAVNDHDQKCEIYSSIVDQNGKWDVPVKLPEVINNPSASNTQPNVGYNQEVNKEVLYFVSNREGGKGGFDLWYSMIDQSGNFSEAMNLSSLNTIQDDITPFYHNESRNLYYSTKGHLGLGGFDIYSVRETSSGWGEIKHLGTPVNSSLDDVYFIRGKSISDYYFASNRTGSNLIDDASEACCLDLYQATIEPCDINLKVLVYDAISKEDLNGATITLYDVKDVKAKPIVITKANSNLSEFPIECDKEYRLEASKPGYITESLSFNSGKPGEFTEINKKLFLTPEKVKLDVLTFEKSESYALNNCTVTLYDLDDPNWKPLTLSDINTNLTHFELTRCHKYRIVASKNGYAQATKEFTVDCKQGGTMTQKLVLQKILQSMLPLILYFDNDRPNPRTMGVSTTLAYNQTYTSYYAKKEEFKKNYAKLSGVDKESSNAEMESFFESDVKGNKERFEQFMKILETELAEGKSYEIILKGFASPRSNNKYNYNLSQRRVKCVENEFSRYNKGVLKKYIKKGLLKISQERFGEDSSPTGIIDDLSDMRSIYMINASKERRVEIVEIR